MIYGSVCSGIEAASVAWEPLGWKASFFSEIEKFPRAVLETYYPGVPLHGDFTTIKEKDYEPIELLVGGTPCQSFSVAGLRKGMDDDRGNLALEYLRLAQRLGPRWLVWENVPGVLSSWSGNKPPSDLEEGQEWEATETSDFGCFLAGLEELGYGFAYRVLDAQYFGVPQRRRRVFVVAYLGDWRPAAAVLFERESLSRNTPPSREEGEGFTHDVAPSLTASGRGVERTGESRGQDPVVAMAHGQGGAEVREDGGCPTLTCNHEAPIVCHGTQDPCVSDKAFALGRNNGQENVVLPIHDKATRYKGGGARQEDGVKRNDGAGNGLGIGKPGDPCYTITSGDKHTIAAFSAGQSKDAGSIAYNEEQAPTLRGGNSGTNQVPTLHADMQVRRLTPVECERLQGFPDNYTFIPRYAKPRKADLEEMARYCGFESVEEYISYGPPGDGPRYKALGNSMAVPVMKWIGERIQAVDELKG